MPVRENNSKSREDRALKSHRSCDVAQGKGVLLLFQPDDAVEFFWKLCGDWRNDQRKKKGRNPPHPGNFRNTSDKELRSADEHRQGKGDLG